MKRFAEFADDKILDGSKIKIDDIINQEVEIIGHAIKTSKYPKNKSGKYLTIQIRIDVDNHVLFTGSDVLIEQFEKYSDQIPFLATIRKINKYYSLT
ncbi:MAG: hypothetical protein H8E14_06015 [Candidatus Marinimicrobia bacterium]|nr:hypothetical protein [Candidatus Neomarinimicrobiota bacterium]